MPASMKQSAWSNPETRALLSEPNHGADGHTQAQSDRDPRDAGLGQAHYLRQRALSRNLRSRRRRHADPDAFHGLSAPRGFRGDQPASGRAGKHRRRNAGNENPQGPPYSGAGFVSPSDVRGRGSGGRLVLRCLRLAFAPCLPALAIPLRHLQLQCHRFQTHLHQPEHRAADGLSARGLPARQGFLGEQCASR